MAKTVELITPEQLKAVHTLYGKVKPPIDKSEMIFCYSDYRTHSSRELTKKEAADLIKALKSFVPTPHEAASDKMRKKIISMAHEMGWRLESGRIDMAHVNAWCRKHGHAKKYLDNYTYEQLPALVTQFEKAYESYMAGLDKTA